MNVLRRDIVVIALVLGLATGCAPEMMCPGQVKAKPSRSTHANNSRAIPKKEKSSLISVTRSTSKHKQQPVFTAKSTSKRKPPK